LPEAFCDTFCTLKKRLLITFVVAVVSTTVIICFKEWLGYHRALFQDRHARDWAMDYASPLDASKRDRAAEALRALGMNAVPALVELLHTRDRAYEKPLAQNVSRMPFELRTNLLAHFPIGSSWGKRFAGATALGFLSTNASMAIPDLLETLDDPVGHIGWAAAAALGKIGSNAVPALIDLAESLDAERAHKAIYALGVAGHNAGSATPVLLNALINTNTSVRASAQYSLSMVGTSALPDICESLRKNDPQMREQLARVVVAVRPPNRSLLMTLNRWMQDESPAVRLQSTEALGNLRLTYAIPMLTRLLNDPEPSVRIAVTNALMQINATALP
jgi:HEAT repeat protein